MSNNYTPAQELAIKTIDANVSVSAGAGSGKTRVLVERFREIVEEQKANADEILAITFTKKAAKEMKERVRSTFLAKVLDSCGAEKTFWQEQLTYLDRAQITTLDSLSGKVLRENPVEAQLDPNYALKEEYEMTDFKQEMIEKFLVTGIQQQDAALMALLECYGHNKLSGALESLQGILPGILAEGNLTKAYKCSPAYKQSVQAELVATAQNLIAGVDKATGKTAAKIIQLEAHVDELSEAIYGESLSEVAALIPGNLVCKALTDEILAFKEAYAAYILSITDSYACVLAGQWESVLKSFAAFYHQAQVEKEYYDFAFVASKAVEVLENFPSILQKYRQKYKYIMVDEFQDTNTEQKRLVYLLAGGYNYKLDDKRLFVVGDGKQSIYRFRGAVVRVFKEVRDDIAATKGKNIIMADNFRSTPQVMDACNCLFGYLLGNDANADVVAQDLTAHREAGPKPEMFVLESRTSDNKINRQAEARLIAQRIKDVVEADPDLHYGDVAILVSVIGSANVFVEALGQLGIGVALTDAKGFYEKQEIVDCYNLFTFCLNQRKDLPLLGLLRSPFFAVDDKALDELLAVKGEHTLWETMADSTQAAVRGAYATLEKLVTVANNLSLTELWNAMYEVLQVEVTLLGQEQGKEKLANVDKLRSMAADLTMKSSGSLEDFVQQLTILREADARAEAANVTKGENAVNIMTIHKSKGLEFPVVVLPSLDHGSKNDTALYRFCPGIGFGIKANIGFEERESSVYTAANEQIKKLEDEEKIRRLYVAMTRAEKYLILSTIKRITINKKGEESARVSGWFGAIEEVFTNPEHEELMSWHTCRVEEVLPLESISAEAKQISVSQETYERIEPVAGYSEIAPMIFSASALQEYDLCPRRFFYNHIAKMPRLEEEVLGDKTTAVSAKILGLIVHRALELQQEIPLPIALERAVKEQEASEQQKAKLQAVAATMLANYCQSPLYKELQGVPQEAEKEFTLELLALPEGKISFTGSIDCLLKYADGTLGIVDFKTGRAPVDGEEKQGYSRQLVIYALAAEKIYGQKVKQAQLHFLQNNSAWQLPINRAEEEEKLKTLMSALLTKKSEQDFAVLPTHCAYCSYKYFCKQK